MQIFYMNFCYRTQQVHLSDESMYFTIDTSNNGKDEYRRALDYITDPIKTRHIITVASDIPACLELLRLHGEELPRQLLINILDARSLQALLDSFEINLRACLPAGHFPRHESVKSMPTLPEDDSCDMLRPLEDLIQMLYEVLHNAQDRTRAKA